MKVLMWLKIFVSKRLGTISLSGANLLKPVRLAIVFQLICYTPYSSVMASPSDSHSTIAKADAISRSEMGDRGISAVDDSLTNLTDQFFRDSKSDIEQIKNIWIQLNLGITTALELRNQLMRDEAFSLADPQDFSDSASGLIELWQTQKQALEKLLENPSYMFFEKKKFLQGLIVRYQNLATQLLLINMYSHLKKQTRQIVRASKVNGTAAKDKNNVQTTSSSNELKLSLHNLNGNKSKEGRNNILPNIFEYYALKIPIHVYFNIFTDVNFYSDEMGVTVENGIVSLGLNYDGIVNVATMALAAQEANDVTYLETVKCRSGRSALRQYTDLWKLIKAADSDVGALNAGSVCLGITMCELGVFCESNRPVPLKKIAAYELNSDYTWISGNWLNMLSAERDYVLEENVLEEFYSSDLYVASNVAGIGKKERFKVGYKSLLYFPELIRVKPKEKPKAKANEKVKDDQLADKDTNLETQQANALEVSDKLEDLEAESNDPTNESPVDLHQEAEAETVAENVSIEAPDLIGDLSNIMVHFQDIKGADIFISDRKRMSLEQDNHLNGGTLVTSEKFESFVKYFDAGMATFLDKTGLDQFDIAAVLNNQEFFDRLVALLNIRYYRGMEYHLDPERLKTNLARTLKIYFVNELEKSIETFPFDLAYVTREGFDEEQIKENKKLKKQILNVLFYNSIYISINSSIELFLAKSIQPKLDSPMTAVEWAEVQSLSDALNRDIFELTNERVDEVLSFSGHAKSRTAHRKITDIWIDPLKDKIERKNNDYLKLYHQILVLRARDMKASEERESDKIPTDINTLDLLVAFYTLIWESKSQWNSSAGEFLEGVVNVANENRSKTLNTAVRKYDYVRNEFLRKFEELERTIKADKKAFSAYQQMPNKETFFTDEIKQKGSTDFFSLNTVKDFLYGTFYYFSNNTLLSESSTTYAEVEAKKLVAKIPKPLQTYVFLKQAYYWLGMNRKVNGHSTYPILLSDIFKPLLENKLLTEDEIEKLANDYKNVVSYKSLGNFPILYLTTQGEKGEDVTFGDAEAAFFFNPFGPPPWRQDGRQRFYNYLYTKSLSRSLADVGMEEVAVLKKGMAKMASEALDVLRTIMTAEALPDLSQIILKSSTLDTQLRMPGIKKHLNYQSVSFLHRTKLTMMASIGDGKLFQSQTAHNSLSEKLVNLKNFHIAKKKKLILDSNYSKAMKHKFKAFMESEVIFMTFVMLSAAKNLIGFSLGSKIRYNVDIFKILSDGFWHFWTLNFAHTIFYETLFEKMPQATNNLNFSNKLLYSGQLDSKGYLKQLGQYEKDWSSGIDQLNNLGLLAGIVVAMVLVPRIYTAIRDHKIKRINSEIEHMMVAAEAKGMADVAEGVLASKLAAADVSLLKRLNKDTGRFAEHLKHLQATGINHNTSVLLDSQYPFKLEFLREIEALLKRNSLNALELYSNHISLKAVVEYLGKRMKEFKKMRPEIQGRVSSLYFDGANYEMMTKELDALSKALK